MPEAGCHRLETKETDTDRHSVELSPSSPHDEPKHRHASLSRGRGRHCLLAVVFVTFSASILAVALVSYYVIVTSGRLLSLEAEVKQSSDALRECLPCRRLVGDNTGSWIVAQASSGDIVCCTKGKNMVAVRSPPPSPSLEDLDKTSTPANLCAAHVFLGPPSMKSSQSGVAAITAWSDVGNHAFMRGGITLNDTSGAFGIRQDGLYELYSHLTFMGTATDARTTKTVFTHRIQIVMNLNHDSFIPVDLLEDEHAVTCETRGPYVTHPCHVSSMTSTLYLRRGDRVSVLANHLDKVIADRKSTYFGLHRIGS